MSNVIMTQEDVFNKIIQYLQKIILDNYRLNCMVGKLMQAHPEINHEAFQKTLEEQADNLREMLQGELYKEHGVLPKTILDLIDFNRK